jgi:decaprenylphospho-beta-D-ribofuranose 2-oxidase
MKIYGWGKYPTIDAKVLLPQTHNDCANHLKSNEIVLPRGMGRSYGDSANSQTVIESTYLDHFIEFDVITGVLTCEAGVSIREILQLIVPKGWFVPVTPGSSFVTIGGAIASDVHGKNHHLSGTFSEHLLSFDLMLGSGEVVSVTKDNYPDLFRATCGGMGLTGIILLGSFQLKPIQSSQIIQSTIKTNSLEEVCEQFEENHASTYSVAWIDCLASGKQLGRSLLMLGEHAEDGALELGKKKSQNLPIDMPQSLLNHYSIKAFNALYYHRVFSKIKAEIISFEPYFYPLDAIGNWNRLYGKTGFVQYQFVLPKVVGVKGLRKILEVIVNSGKGSFLAVLKAFGRANENFLSFPVEGYTLALDFKMSEETVQLIKLLDSMVVEMGGRIYLTKDALMTEASFKRTYSQWEQFEEVRAKYGAIGKFASSQSKRLGLQ